MLEVPRYVRANLPAFAHGFALLFAWAANRVLAQNDVGAPGRSIAAACVYLLILALWATLFSRLATNPDRWRESMRAREQTYVGDDLDTTLRSQRRRLFGMELIVVVPLLVLATAVSLKVPDDVAVQLPVGLAALATTCIGLDFVRAFGRSLLQPLQSVGASVALESAAEQSEGLDEYVRAAVQTLSRRLGLFAVVILVLEATANALGVLDLLKDIAEWLAHVLT